MFAVLSNQINTMSSPPTYTDTSTPPDPTTVVPANMKDPPLEGVHSTKIGSMWTLKNEISSPKFYEILIKTELKEDTDLDIKNFYNHINMCINAVTRLREDLIPGYHSIKKTLSLMNTSSQIVITLPITGMSRYTLTLYTHYYWQLLITLVKIPP